MSQIFSIGIDLVEISRMKRAVDANPAILKRLFSDTEISLFADIGSAVSKYKVISVFFAIKEAVLKACGTGWQEGVSWKDIRIKDYSFKQKVIIRGKLKGIVNKYKISDVFVVVSADKKLALAKAYALI